ncbi:helix-turn-helix transcriptional regulator [Burkholderia ubonensis]|uniref:helix-turn-helix transcriptional regulator n=1 Tax=Burkholderia ubonensis TaxID=101571 RepID=UPI0009B35FD0|nr:AlpA family transcriptional regulator [Burkholderia ubonensis]
MVSQNPQRFLRIHEVIYKSGLTRAAIYALPDFPKPVKIGPRASAWVESEVESWMAARMAARGVA